MDDALHLARAQFGLNIGFHILFPALTIALCQGVMLGRYVTGFQTGFLYGVFAAFAGASLCGGYVLLGATWLIAKTEGELQRKAVAWARWGLLWVGLGVALVSLATPLVSETVRAKWFAFPRAFAVMPLPIACAAVWLWIWHILGRFTRAGGIGEWRPSIGAVAIFVLAPRPRLQPLPVRRDRPADNLGSRRASLVAQGRARGNGDRPAFHRCVHGRCLPHLPRQGEGGPLRLNTGVPWALASGGHGPPYATLDEHGTIGRPMGAALRRDAASPVPPYGFVGHRSCRAGERSESRRSRRTARDETEGTVSGTLHSMAFAASWSGT